jgi:SAM-dependent methyltransferase
MSERCCVLYKKSSSINKRAQFELKGGIMKHIQNDEIIQEVRRHYAEIAIQKKPGCYSTASSCCETKPLPAPSKHHEIFRYSEQEISNIPVESLMGLGCGNPCAIAVIKFGETVLDLGSGGGMDCFLAAKKVGNTGHVIGVDMTPEMLRKARNDAIKYGYKNIEFRLGEIENLPVADASVDVIISNCVINLSPDKPRVFAEAFRVLKPGGRFTVSDMIATAPLPEKIKKDLSLYVGCVAGAVYIDDLKKMLKEAGFYKIKIQLNDGSGNDCAKGKNLEDVVTSGMIEAIKLV